MQGSLLLPPVRRVPRNDVAPQQWLVLDRMSGFLGMYHRGPTLPDGRNRNNVLYFVLHLQSFEQIRTPSCLEPNRRCLMHVSQVIGIYLPCGHSWR